MDEREIVQALRSAFAYSYRYDDWVSPIFDELSGLTLREALWKEGPEGRSIWEIALHLAVWNENIVARVQTGTERRPPEGSWPELPESTDSHAWSETWSRLRNSYEAVDRMLRTCSLTQIQASPYGLPDVILRFTHSGYHIGQIVKIRAFYAACGVAQEPGQARGSPNR